MKKKTGQKYLIKRILEDQGENLTVMARKLNIPYGTVVCNVYGYRQNVQVQQEIAGYLGRKLDELFTGNGGAGESITEANQKGCLKK